MFHQREAEQTRDTRHPDLPSLSFLGLGERAVGSGCKLLAFTSMVYREIFPATNWSARGQMILDIYQINEISRVTRFKQPKKSRI